MSAYINSLTRGVFQKAQDLMVNRAKACIRAWEGHFEHLL